MAAHDGTENTGGARALSGTRERIVEAAGEVFAESGYRHTTVRAICKRAGANVAAVNYYFGDKSALYLAVLKYWRRKAFEEYPLDIGNTAGRPPEELLGAFVKTLIFRVLDKGRGSRFARLMAQELMQPTVALDVIIEETIRPHFGFLSGVVRRLLGEGHTEVTVQLCCVSIVGQIFYFYLSRPVLKRLLNREGFEKKEILAIAEHITAFSLSGIRQIAASAAKEEE
jgi:AcrR family transcriptional regulator